MLQFFSLSERRARTGFTLIELLVVIAIIGILASIVVASLNTARKKSRDARRIADIKQMQLALELYYDAGKGNDGAGTFASYPIATATLAPTYIPGVPKDPTGNNAYAYLAVDAAGAACAGATTACTSYRLGATLSDTSNQALNNDADSAAIGANFSGLSASVEGTACVNAAGTAQPGGTETCYDVKP